MFLTFSSRVLKKKECIYFKDTLSNCLNSEKNIPILNLLKMCYNPVLFFFNLAHSCLLYFLESCQMLGSSSKSKKTMV